jgi:C-terminal domain of 1-Cys peroxiredoxin
MGFVVNFRGLFIIDHRGILRQITMNDLPVGRSVDETLRLVQAFQYTDSHGEVCPAGWKPGQDTVKFLNFLVKIVGLLPFLPDCSKSGGENKIFRKEPLMHPKITSVPRQFPSSDIL